MQSLKETAYMCLRPCASGMCSAPGRPQCWQCWRGHAGAPPGCGRQTRGRQAGHAPRRHAPCPAARLHYQRYCTSIIVRCMHCRFMVGLNRRFGQDGHHKLACVDCLQSRFLQRIDEAWLEMTEIAGRNFTARSSTLQRRNETAGLRKATRLT